MHCAIFRETIILNAVSFLSLSYLAFIQVKGLKTFFVGTKSAHERVSSENGAKSISSIHHDIMFDPKQAFEDIPKVIELVETYDTASIRKVKE